MLAKTSHVGPLLGRDAARIANHTLDWCMEKLRIVQ